MSFERPSSGTPEKDPFEKAQEMSEKLDAVIANQSKPKVRKVEAEARRVTDTELARREPEIININPTPENPEPAPEPVSPPAQPHAQTTERREKRRISGRARVGIAAVALGSAVTAGMKIQEQLSKPGEQMKTFSVQKYFHQGEWFKPFEKDFKITKITEPENQPPMPEFKIPASQPETQPATQPEIEPDTQPGTQPEVATSQPETQPTTEPEATSQPAPEKTEREKAIEEQKKISDRSDADFKARFNRLNSIVTSKPHFPESKTESKAATQPVEKKETKEATMKPEKEQKAEKVPSKAKWSQDLTERAQSDLDKNEVISQGDAKAFVDFYFVNFVRSYDATRLKDINAAEATAMGKFATEMKTILIAQCEKHGLEKEKKNIEKEFQQIANDTAMKSTYEYQKRRELDKQMMKNRR